jgi:hypothetical protein
VASAPPAPSPPAKREQPAPTGVPVPIENASQLRGSWEGEVRRRGAVDSLSITFDADGSASWRLARDSGTAHFRIDGGRVLWRAATGNAVGILYEGDGRRVLRFSCDDNACTSELTRRE